MPPMHCDGCLGSERCWVCLATGNANTEARTGICHRCAGSGICLMCQPRPLTIAVPAQGGRPTREDYADGLHIAPEPRAGVSVAD